MRTTAWFAVSPFAQRWAWRLDKLLKPGGERLPPHPADDPAYWEMIEVVHQAWGRTCGDSMRGVPHMDFERSFLRHLEEGADAAGLSDAAQMAASEEAQRRIDERREALNRVRLVERRFAAGDNLREIKLVSGTRELGLVRYGACPAGEHGWFGKISLAPDWHRGGLGRRVVKHLTQRYPQATWTTSAQMAPGFWEAVRRESDAGWTVGDGACDHGWEPLPSRIPAQVGLVHEQTTSELRPGHAVPGAGGAGGRPRPPSRGSIVEPEDDAHP